MTIFVYSFKSAKRILYVKQIKTINVKVKTDLNRKGRGGERRDWAGLWQTWYNVTRGERRELKVTPAMVRHFSS